MHGSSERDSKSEKEKLEQIEEEEKLGAKNSAETYKTDSKKGKSTK